MKSSSVLLLILFFAGLISCEKTETPPKPESYLEYLSDKTIASIKIFNNQLWVSSSKYCDTCYTHPALSAIPTIEQLTLVENEKFEYEEATLFGTPISDNSGNLFVASRNKLYKINDINDYTLFADIKGFSFNSFAFDKEDNIWFSGHKGIAFWNKEGLTIFNSDNSDLPSNTTHGLAIDNEGTIWIALDFNGLLKIDSNNWEIIPNGNIPGLSHLSYLRSPIVDADNNIWFEVFSSNENSNIIMFNGQEWKYQYPGETGNGIFHGTLSRDSKGRIWSINAYFDPESSTLSRSTLSLHNNNEWETIDLQDVNTRILDVNANDNRIYIGTINGLFERSF